MATVTGGLRVSPSGATVLATTALPAIAGGLLKTFTAISVLATTNKPNVGSCTGVAIARRQEYWG